MADKMAWRQDAEPASTTGVSIFREALDTAPEAVFWMDSQGGMVYVNDRACASLGYTREELSALHIWDIDPGVDRKRWEECWDTVLARSTLETYHRRKDGTVFPVEVSTNDFDTGRERLRVSFVRDISDRKRAEEERLRLESQLLHAQKLESVGRLAGGVAHDFNNMLSVILGYAELIEQGLAPHAPIRDAIEEIKKAAARSRNVTRQLLAFSRKQLIAPRPLDLNRVVSEAKNALLRLIGEDIDLRFVPGDGLSKISFDPSQMDQVLVNLVVNARDALPSSGTIRLETANVRLDEEACRDRAEASPGPYVVLRVSDDGVGIDRDVLPYIFEPFFTTKDVGKGTGLGLATVYGIIKQNGGFVEVLSEPGAGTTFELYIPALPVDTIEPGPSLQPPPMQGRGRVLVVEDDDMVRNMTKKMLEALGYTVLAASTPSVALATCQSPDLQIDLLISDVVMPEMKGTELRDRLRALRPDLKVLFISGYADLIVRDGVLDEREHFIQKPFTMSDLARSASKAMCAR